MVSAVRLSQGDPKTGPLLHWGNYGETRGLLGGSIFWDALGVLGNFEEHRQVRYSGGLRHKVLGFRVVVESLHTDLGLVP